MFSYKKHIPAVLFIFLILLLGSCRSKRGPKEYIEKNGLHSDKKPHELAKEIGDLSKGQSSAYQKQLRRTNKEIKKRNKKKVKSGYYKNK